MEQSTLIGGILIALGILVMFLGNASSSKESSFSFVGFVGPIPFGFGDDKNLLTTTVLIGFTFLIITWFLLRIQYGR